MNLYLKEMTKARLADLNWFADRLQYQKQGISCASLERYTSLLMTDTKISLVLLP